MKITRPIFLALLFALLCAPAWAAPVAQGTTTSLGDADGCTVGTDCTLGPFSVPAGSKRLATVSVFVTAAAGWTSESATLGGVALSAIGRSPASGGSNVLRTWCLPEADFPATGDQNLVLGGSGTPTRWSAIVTFYTNAAQTCPITNDIASNGDGVESVSNALTPIAAGSILQHVVGIVGDRGSTLAATSPQVIPSGGKIVTNARSHAISTDSLDALTEATAEFTWTTNSFYFSSAFIIEPAPDPAITISDAAIFPGPWPGHSQILHFGGDSK